MSDYLCIKNIYNDSTQFTSDIEKLAKSTRYLGVQKDGSITEIGLWDKFCAVVGGWLGLIEDNTSAQKIDLALKSFCEVNQALIERPQLEDILKIALHANLVKSPTGNEEARSVQGVADNVHFVADMLNQLQNKVSGKEPASNEKPLLEKTVTAITDVVHFATTTVKEGSTEDAELSDNLSLLGDATPGSQVANLPVGMLLTEEEIPEERSPSSRSEEEFLEAEISTSATEGKTPVLPSTIEAAKEEEPTPTLQDVYKEYPPQPLVTPFQQTAETIVTLQELDGPSSESEHQRETTSQSDRHPPLEDEHNNSAAASISTFQKTIADDSLLVTHILIAEGNTSSTQSKEELEVVEKLDLVEKEVTAMPLKMEEVASSPAIVDTSERTVKLEQNLSGVTVPFQQPGPEIKEVPAEPEIDEHPSAYEALVEPHDSRSLQEETQETIFPDELAVLLSKASEIADKVENKEPPVTAAQLKSIPESTLPNEEPVEGWGDTIRTAVKLVALAVVAGLVGRYFSGPATLDAARDSSLFVPGASLYSNPSPSPNWDWEQHAVTQLPPSQQFINGSIHKLFLEDGANEEVTQEVAATKAVKAAETSPVEFETKIYTAANRFDTSIKGLIKPANVNEILLTSDTSRNIFTTQKNEGMVYSLYSQQAYLEKNDNLQLKRLDAFYRKQGIVSGAEPLIYKPEHEENLREVLIKYNIQLTREPTYWEKLRGISGQVDNGEFQTYLDKTKDIIGQLNNAIKYNIEHAVERQKDLKTHQKDLNISSIRGLILGQIMPFDLIIMEHLANEGLILNQFNDRENSYWWVDSHKTSWIQC